MTEEIVANIFGMPPRNVTRLPQDERQALNSIMGGLGFPSIYKPAEPEPVIVAVPATVDEMHAIGEGIRNDPEPGTTPDQAPSAISLINAIATEYGVEPAIAISWLDQRADEFKHLNQLAKVML